jgi:quercetin dioxygenase-like cupin family protein
LSERTIVCADLNSALDDLKDRGFRMDIVYPADEPHTALLSRDGEAVRVTSKPDAPPVRSTLPPIEPEFVLTRAGADPGSGRAGMLYRDLIPGRLGGRYIASHITIPEGGPVADWVHYHRIALQLIYVRRGWVRLVYEDQGEPFVLEAGDLVLQPPLIRHRVLESSPGLEVVEISAPALHETFADHQLELPNGAAPERMFGRQRFVRHVAKEARWTAFGGGLAQETAIGAATAGLAQLRTIKPVDGQSISFAPHPGELVFGFVLDGHATLAVGDRYDLAPGDAFAVPPQQSWSIEGPADDFRLLHVTTSALDELSTAG